MNRPDKYILKDKKAIPCNDILEWGKMMQNNEARRVAFNKIREIDISTVFIGLDHAIYGSPMIYETMVFGGEMDQETYRYSTWEEAEQGHKEICKKIIESL